MIESVERASEQARLSGDRKSMAILTTRRGGAHMSIELSVDDVALLINESKEIRREPQVVAKLRHLIMVGA